MKAKGSLLLLLAGIVSAAAYLNRTRVVLEAPEAHVVAPEACGAPVYCEVADRLKPAETLYDLLLRHRIQPQTVVDIAAALSQQIPPRQLWPGDEFNLFFSPDEQLAALEIERSPLERYRLEYDGDGYNAALVPVDADTLPRSIWGRIDDNLWNSFANTGAPPELIVSFTEIFAWSVDFFREVQPGDAFGAVFSELLVEGEPVQTGAIEAAYYVHGTDTMWAFGFAEGGDVKYYDRAGNSLQKALIRAPLKFSRVSSGFSGKRLHPVYGVYRPHNGCDYAAPAGTSVYAAGDGQVRYVGWKNGLGKCVEIRHPNGYTTVYGHLMGFAKGMSVGKRVDQRDVIGYVGMTGNASGYHLHYEVRVSGRAVNPMTIKLPASGPVPTGLRPYFEDRRDSLFEMLQPTYGPPLADIS